MFMPCEMTNHRLRELDVIGRAHGDGILVSAGLESDLKLVDERVVNDGGEAKKPTDGRLSAQLAFGEKIFKLPLIGDGGVVGAQLVTELFHVDVIRGGQGAEDKLPVGFDKDGFDDDVAGDVLLLGEVLRGVSTIVLR